MSRKKTPKQANENLKLTKFDKSYLPPPFRKYSRAFLPKRMRSIK
jgi:hypothetical protein